MGEQKARIPLLERDQVSPEIAAVYDALLKQRGVVPNLFKTLAHTCPGARRCGIPTGHPILIALTA